MHEIQKVYVKYNKLLIKSMAIISVNFISPEIPTQPSSFNYIFSYFIMKFYFYCEDFFTNESSVMNSYTYVLNDRMTTVAISFFVYLILIKCTLKVCTYILCFIHPYLNLFLTLYDFFVFSPYHLFLTIIHACLNF